MRCASFASLGWNSPPMISASRWICRRPRLSALLIAFMIGYAPLDARFIRPLVNYSNCRNCRSVANSLPSGTKRGTNC